MINLPNFISILRIPLAFLFLQENPLYRVLAIVFAMVSDGLDGYLARKNSTTTKFGTLIDPVADKFFVIFVLSVLMKEHKLEIWQAAAFLCRDFSVFIFGLYLLFSSKLATYQFRSIWCGKLTTFLQFITLIALTLNLAVPPALFLSFIILGLCALVELYDPLDLRKEKI